MKGGMNPLPRPRTKLGMNPRMRRWMRLGMNPLPRRRARLRMRKAVFLLVFLLLVAGSPDLCGQEGPLGYQIRAGGTLPLGGFRKAEEGWEGGVGGAVSFGMGFSVSVWGPFHVYMGFSQDRFICDKEVCPPGAKWVSTGFDVALRGVFGAGRIRPAVQGGFHLPRVEGEILDARDQTSDRGRGYEAGAGVLIRIGERTSLNPGARYGEVDVLFADSGTLKMRYLVVDLGLVLAL